MYASEMTGMNPIHKHLLMGRKKNAQHMVIVHKVTAQEIQQTRAVTKSQTG
jgi:hypothetical protein